MKMINKLCPESWVDNYGDRLFAYTLQRINHNISEAEDLVQDVFLSAWRAKDTFTGEASEKTWLFTICKNKIIDYYRRSNKANVFTEESLAAENEQYFTDDGHLHNSIRPLKEWHIGSNNPLQEKDFFSVLTKCKSKLKQIQDNVFTMRYLHELDSTEICHLLGISIKNYWVLIHRAKLQLRTCLEKNWLKY